MNHVNLLLGLVYSTRSINDISTPGCSTEALPSDLTSMTFFVSFMSLIENVLISLKGKALEFSFNFVCIFTLICSDDDKNHPWLSAAKAFTLLATC